MYFLRKCMESMTIVISEVTKKKKTLQEEDED
jgi:hypothetical protein